MTCDSCKRTKLWNQGKVSASSCVLPGARRYRMVLRGSAVTDVCGVCATCHQIIALWFNTATRHKAGVTWRAATELSPLVSRLSLRTAEQAHRKAAQTPHRALGPGCSQTMGSIWSCSVLALHWLEFQHPQGACPSSHVHPSDARSVPSLPRPRLCTPVPAQVGALKP